MTPVRTTLAAAALLLAVGACGSGEPPAQAPASAPPPASAAPQPGAPQSGVPQPAPRTGEEAAAEATFRGYHQALRARDFATACALQTPEFTRLLLEGFLAQGGTAATCEEVFAAAYADPAQAQFVDRLGDTVQVQDVTVAGDTAQVTWSTEVRPGERQETASTLQRVDGEWLMAPPTVTPGAG